MPFDEYGDIRTAGNNPPTSLTRLVQRGTDKIRSDTSAAKFVRDKGVIEHDAVALESVTEERRRPVTGANFETSGIHIMRYGKRYGWFTRAFDVKFHGDGLMIFEFIGFQELRPGLRACLGWFYTSAPIRSGRLANPLAG